MTEWLPIKDAPKNQYVLLSNPDWVVFGGVPFEIARLENGEWISPDYALIRHATVFTHLPEPPHDQ